MKTFQRLPFGLRIKFKLLGLDFIASYDLVSSCSLSLALPFTFSSSLSELPTRPSWAMVFRDPLSCQVLFPQPGTHFYFSSLTSSASLSPHFFFTLFFREYFFKNVSEIRDLTYLWLPIHSYLFFLYSSLKKKKICNIWFNQASKPLVIPKKIQIAFSKSIWHHLFISAIRRRGTC